MNHEPLSTKALNQALKSLEGWELVDNRLTKTFKFKNFREAVAFIVRISFHADSLDHHPILYNVYNQVQIDLTTHSVGNKVTQSDVLLAGAIEQVFSNKS